MLAGISGHPANESKRPGPRGPGPGCKSPAGRRRCCGECSAGRSAASRDGRRALIARSQDLPTDPLPGAVLEPPRDAGSIPAGSARMPREPGPRRRMRRLPYWRTRGQPRPSRRALLRGRPTIGCGAPRERRRSPAVLLSNSPSSGPSVPHAGPGLPGIRSGPKTIDRPPRASGGDRWIRIRAISPVGRVPARGRKIMVARFVTLVRDLPRRPFAGSEVRSLVRGRRPEWPPVRRVRRAQNTRPRPRGWVWAGGPGAAASKVDGVLAPPRGPWYRSTQAPLRRVQCACNLWIRSRKGATR